MEIDLDALCEKIKKTIVKDGLTWGINHQKEPLAFGLYKLIMVCTVFDEVCKVDEIEEELEALEEVSSITIAEWQKL